MANEKTERDNSAKRLELLELLLKEKGSQARGKAERIKRESEGLSSAPLSFPQQRIWFIQQLMPESAVFNIFKAVRLKGRLRIDALEKTLTEIHRRHEALRTTFELVGDQPRQVIHPAQPMRLPVEALEHISPLAREEAAKELARIEAKVPFDLGHGPAMRCKLIRLDDEDHILLLNVHHIASDGWSHGLILKETVLIYEAFSAGKPSPLPDLKIQYADFTAWQWRQMDAGAWDGQLDYWRSKLEGMPSSLDLVHDFKLSSPRTFRAGLESIIFPEALREKLIRFSRRREATLFMTLLAGFCALLFRYTGQKDFSIGTPIANRRYSEMEDLIGIFINTLVMRASCNGSSTVRELLELTKRAALGGYANQDVPFEKIVEELRPERVLNQQPLFQHMFVLRNEPVEKLQCSDLEVTYLSADEFTTTFDLELSIHDVEGELSCWMQYGAELFAPATVRRMLEHFRNLLHDIVDNPDKKIGELAYLSETERQQVASEWSSRDEPVRNELPIHRLFETHAKNRPMAVALELDAAELTYAEVNRRSNCLADFLLEQELQPESLVAICLHRSFWMPISLLAILKAGGAYLPLDPSFSREWMAHLLKDSGASIVITERSSVARVPENVKTIVLEDIEEDLRQRQGHNLETSDSMDQLAYVTYTSGSSGGPKGVAVTHRNVTRLVLDQNYAELTRDAVFLQLSAVSFDASTFEIWGSLANGARLCIYPPHTPSLKELAVAIQQRHVTVMFLTTPLFQQMAETHPESFSGLRQLLTGGDVMPLVQSLRVVEVFTQGQLINVYGPTESTTFTSFYPVSAHHDFSRPIPIGFPIRGTTVFVADRDLMPVGIGVAGELYVGGEGVARGYFKRPSLTAEKFVPDPFSSKAGSRLYRTGDGARWLPDGSLEFLGRIDDQVKVRGFRIEPAEIEDALGRHEEIAMCAVVPRQDNIGQKQLVAYYVSKTPEMRPATNELRLYLRGKLPEYMVPARFIPMCELPFTTSGKIDRNALPELAPLPHIDSASDLSDLTCTERFLIAIWSEVLGVGNVDLDDNFFDLGGHSLMATQVLSRTRERLSVDLALRVLFEFPTVRSFAAAIDNQKKAGVELEAARPLVSSEDRELEALIEQVAGLSEEEVQSILAKKDS